MGMYVEKKIHNGMYRKKYIDTKIKVRKKKKMAMQGNITVWVLESYFQNRKKMECYF